MIEQPVISHHIQKHIIGVLMFHEFARFRDLRPPKTDTNLFSYHLKILIKSGLVAKTDRGYGLSVSGLAYVDRVSSLSKSVRTQPKIITMILIQNSDGDILLWRRQRQPYINDWTLPYGKLHTDDESLHGSAQRELREKVGMTDLPVRHVGDCYIRVLTDLQPLSVTLAHIFRLDHDDIPMNENLMWVRPHRLAEYRLAPAVEAIVARSFFGDPFFFEEFEQDYQASSRLGQPLSNPAVD